MSAKKITVLGIGNLLLRDEGVGIHVIEAMKKELLPENVELVDGAVAGFDLLPIVQNCDRLIVVDAIKTAESPGTIYRFNPEQIDIQRDTNVSLHDVDFFQVMEFAKQYKKLPPTSMITIVPEDISWGIGLSDTVAQKIPALIKLVKDTLDQENDSAVILKGGQDGEKNNGFV